MGLNSSLILLNLYLCVIGIYPKQSGRRI